MLGVLRGRRRHRQGAAVLAAVLVLADVDGAVGIGDLRRGTFTFASGAVYLGEYQDSKQHGGSFELSFYVADKQSGESVWFSKDRWKAWLCRELSPSEAARKVQELDLSELLK